MVTTNACPQPLEDWHDAARAPDVSNCVTKIFAALGRGFKWPVEKLPAGSKFKIEFLRGEPFTRSAVAIIEKFASTFRQA